MTGRNKASTHFGFWGLWGILFSILVGILLCPVLLLFVMGIVGFGEDWQISLGRYGWDTGVVGLVAGAVAVLLGVPAGYLRSHFDFPLRKVWGFLGMLPLAIPVHVMAIAYKEFFEYGGLFWKIWGLEYYIDVMNEYGAGCIFGFALSPYVYLGASSAFSWALQYSEVSLTLQVGLGFRYLWGILLKLSSPYILISGFLVGLEAVNNYSVAYYFGLETYGTAFYQSWTLHNDLGFAMRIACIMFLGTWVLVIPIYWANQRQKSMGRPRGTQLRVLRGWRVLGGYFVMGGAVLWGFLLPLWQLLYWASLGDSSFLGDFAVFWNSLELGVLVSLVAMGLGLFLSMGRMEIPEKKTPKLLYAVLAFYYGAPSIILVFPFFYLEGFYEGIGVLVGILVMKFLPLNSFLIETQIRSISSSLFLTSRSLGIGRMRTFLRVMLPLLAPSLSAGGIFTFLEVVKEVPVTFMTAPGNYTTLATQSFQLLYEGRIIESAWPSLGIVGLGILAILCIYLSFEWSTSYYLYAQKEI